MQALWAIFQILVVMPFIAFVVFGITFFSTQTPGGIFAGIILGLLSVIAYWLLIAASGRKKIRKHVESKINNMDYFSILFDSAIAIDREQGVVFAGTVKNGELLSFEDIKNIEREESTSNGEKQHRIKISTNNFDKPYISISSPTEALAAQAYEKLRIALEMKRQPS